MVIEQSVFIVTVRVGTTEYTEYTEREFPIPCFLCIPWLAYDSSFNPEETYAYIQHRLRTEGGDSSAIFEAAAIESIESLSQGMPRRINRLCNLALMIAYAEEMPRITAEYIGADLGLRM